VGFMPSKQLLERATPVGINIYAAWSFEFGWRLSLFAVGTAIAGRPPPRSGLAQLRHPAPTLGV